LYRNFGEVFTLWELLTCTPKIGLKPELDYNLKTTGGENEETIYRGADRQDFTKGGAGRYRPGSDLKM